jgi:hypothetical protein
VLSAGRSSIHARLELLGDRASDVAVVHSLRDSLARDLVRQKRVVGEENAETFKRILEERPR